MVGAADGPAAIPAEHGGYTQSTPSVWRELSRQTNPLLLHESTAATGERLRVLCPVPVDRVQHSLCEVWIERAI